MTIENVWTVLAWVSGGLTLNVCHIETLQRFVLFSQTQRDETTTFQHTANVLKVI